MKLFFSTLELVIDVFTGHLVGTENKLGVSGVATSCHGPQGLMQLESSAVDTVRAKNLNIFCFFLGVTL